MRMVTLILLSDASSLALEYPSRIVRRMSGRRRRIFLASSTISGMREWDARNTQRFSSVAGLFEGVFEQGAQEFLGLPCAVELSPGIRASDVLERLGLSAGQVAGVLQDRVLDAAHALHGLLVPVAPRLVPQAFPDLVERVGHPGDDVEPVQYAFGVRAALGDARVDPAGPVAGDDLDGGALFGRQRLEEQAEHVPAVPVARPDDPMPLVVDDHGQVRVALPCGWSRPRRSPSGRRTARASTP